MKFLIVLLGTLIFVENSYASSLKSFYYWADDAVCPTSSSECSANRAEKIVKLLSASQGYYSQTVLDTIFHTKTCEVEIIEYHERYKDRYKESIGTRGFIKCASEFHATYNKIGKYKYKIFSEDFVNNYDSELQEIFDKAKRERDIDTLERLVSEFSHHRVANLAKNSIINFDSEEKKQRQSVMNEYKNAKTIQQKAEVLAKTNNGKAVAEGWIKYSDVINQEMANKFVTDIFKSVEDEDNIAGYSWFIANNPDSKLAKKALTNMHELAFELAEDIDTINAYNDFIIAYPTAKQVREANDRAYELEKSEYVGMLSYFSEEKDARRLLVQSKMLEQSAEDLSSDEQIGYMIVVNRMNDLLKQEFVSTDAALRHLESNEFKSFVRTFKRSMENLDRQVSRIADNTADLSSIMKQQSSMMNNHFDKAAQDREMASELTKQHRHWERFIGEVGL
ncbi:hypothetical protein [Glaciecola sp. 1036]|uniref:hypothetical protein n=1 Tax=Alteromonadaceae TaxID=72275 RepID=UPI003D006B77